MNALGILEVAFELDDFFMVDASVNVDFVENLFLQAILLDGFFVHALECIVSSRTLAPDVVDLPEAAFPDHFNPVKVNYPCWSSEALKIIRLG